MTDEEMCSICSLYEKFLCESRSLELKQVKHREVTSKIAGVYVTRKRYNNDEAVIQLHFSLFSPHRDLGYMRMSKPLEASPQCQPQHELQKGELYGSLDKQSPITIIPASYKENCQFSCNEDLASCECGCRDYLAYLHRPLLSACESIIEGFTPGPARDRQILQILRAGHRPDFDNYVRVHRHDLLERHEAALAIVRDYREGMAIVEKIRANAIIYEELLREDPEDGMQDVDEEILPVT
ncbi:hypothetical protein BT96DRAFT_950157 [Gymnopus androsaceus JB14]|uniref:Uncharacterized protein n=1 Tax=Gymnopus androsaceus JB14 TaxID=1447944 RepID=A0A6A4GHF4_9AGAR|nr:hypothetical protein BT96DRAFT_950157 [Gymnopus androsaceus JB14]